MFALSINANTDPNDFEELKKLEGKWVGTLERSNDTTDDFTLEFSITSNGSAILEESNTGGTEMLTIFNNHNNELLLTHYCGLQNKPVSILETTNNGKFTFQTDSKRSGLSLENRNKVFFIHMNHTNMMLDPNSELSKLVTSKGFNIARLGQKLYL